jgi:PKD repeat protein
MQEPVANETPPTARPKAARGLLSNLLALGLLLCVSGITWGATLSLSWNASTGAAGYRLYYGTATGTYSNSINAGAATSASATGLTPGQRYYFAVTAYGASGAESAYSSEVNAVAPAAPVASFVADKTSGAAPLGVNFNSSASTGTITSYSWTFGDGGTSTAANPSYSYAVAGTYTVALTVSGPSGSNTQTRAGYIAVGTAAPIASFVANVTSGTAPLAVSFTNLSTGTITTSSWTFGDGGTSTATNPSHTYANPGTYSVGLTVTGPGGSNLLTRSGYISVQPPAAPAMAAQPSAVDLHAASGTTGDLNGVLEPGESVMLERAWRNDSGSAVSATGTISNFTGPAGATYTINDNSASYGTIAPGATAACGTATGDCYRLTISNPATRPMQHWDATVQENLSTGNVATITVHVGRSFGDMPVTDPFYGFVEAMMHNGVTRGFADGTFRPPATITRAQTLMFTARAVVAPDGDAPIPPNGTVGGLPYNCASGGTSLFADVAPMDVGCKQIHFLAARNVAVTFGCTDTSHACPAANTTRAMMAVHIAGAAAGGDANVPSSATYSQTGSPRSYNCNAGGSSHFVDVGVTSPSCRHINYLWATGSIDGFADGTFQPSALVTRAQMAKFINNSFDLTLD